MEEEKRHSIQGQMCRKKNESVFWTLGVIDGQMLTITLKQLSLVWKPVDAEEGAYLETYDGYSGQEINIMLQGEKVTAINNIAYGKYEIAVKDAANFKFRDITELNTRNVTFSYEDGKYYVTYSYAYEDAREDLNVNLLLNSSRGYTSEQKVSNYFKPGMFSWGTIELPKYE